MTDIERYQQPEHRPDTIALAGDAWRLSQRIATTEFVPKALRGRPEAVLAAILTGHEAGVSPMQSLSKIHIIEGKPAFSSELMRGLILQAGHEVWIEESTSTRCTIGAKRAGSERETKVTWTLDDAKRANLSGKDVWRRYPADMLLARATARLARMVFPDVLAGLSYTAEELSDGDVFDPLAEPEEAKPTPARKARASRTATRGSTAPADTEPAITPPPVREQAPLPGEDDDEVEAELVTFEDVAEAAFEKATGSPPPDRMPRRPPQPAEEPYEGPDRHVEGSGPRLTGPALIATKLGERGIHDRDDRLSIVSAILERDELIESTKDLTPDEVVVVTTWLEHYPKDGELPRWEGPNAAAFDHPDGCGHSCCDTPLDRFHDHFLEPGDCCVGTRPAGDSTTDVPEPEPSRPAPIRPAAQADDPETWDADRWRAFLRQRGVRVGEVIRQAQAEAKDGETVIGNLRDIAGSGKAATLVGFAESITVGRP